MNTRERLRARLSNLHIAQPQHVKAADVVSALGALQAQDYTAALWAIGLRLRDGTLQDVQRAAAERTIIRTWAMRGTLHFVAARDVHWLLDLLAPRTITANAKRHRDLQLDAATFLKAEKALGKALEGGRQLTREGVRRVLERAKLRPEGQRLYHVIARLAQDKLLCCGPNEGGEQTFTLLRDWVKAALQLEPEAALAELARRYFSSHGPATQRDLMRWAGINAREARLAIAAAGDSLASESHFWFAADQPPPSAASRGLFLLPSFDEYVIGYADRSDFLAAEHADKLVPGNSGVYRPAIVSDGRVIGTWKATRTKRGWTVEPALFAALKPAQRAQLTRAAASYTGFVGGHGPM